jgi:polyisoprenoid-binding protein YceI
MIRSSTLAALLVLASPAVAAQPADHLSGKIEPVIAGTYAVEPGHTQVAFSVSHMGISPYTGWFSGASGTLVIDPAAPAKAALSVEIPIASVSTTSDKLTDELKSADWFDAAKFPTASFRSTSVRLNGRDAAEVSGTLTLHGVSRPVVMTAKLFGATPNAMSHAPSIGFTGRMVIRRSEFGVSKYVPLVSDEVELVINAAFEKAEQPHAKN